MARILPRGSGSMEAGELEVVQAHERRRSSGKLAPEWMSAELGDDVHTGSEKSTAMESWVRGHKGSDGNNEAPTSAR